MRIRKRGFYFLISVLLLYSCRNEKASYIALEGFTMGTTYHIKYASSRSHNFGKQIDSLLVLVNRSLSMYDSTSTISLFNRSREGSMSDSLFRIVFRTAKDIYKRTKKAFDPSIMPLVNAWGFGFENRSKMDSVLVDSLLNLLGFGGVSLNSDMITKNNPDLMLDFAAIAKGFGVDLVAEFLEEQGIQDYMVEIGGEVRAKGKNPAGEAWKIGIERPAMEKDQVQEFDLLVHISDMSVATSGNYRNYYVENGKRYAHIVSPFTGFPVEHNLLSVSVFSKKCMIADAFATGLMVLGTELSKEIDKGNKDILILLIFENAEGKLDLYYSEELKEYIQVL
jgi:FAD:protein FMN transferase